MDRACLWDEWYIGGNCVSATVFTGDYRRNENGGYFCPTGVHGFFMRKMGYGSVLPDEGRIEIPGGQAAETMYASLTPGKIRSGGKFQVRNSKSRVIVMPDTQDTWLRVRILYYHHKSNKNLIQRIVWERKAYSGFYSPKIHVRTDLTHLARYSEGYLSPTTQTDLSDIYAYLEAVWQSGS